MLTSFRIRSSLALLVLAVNLLFCTDHHVAAEKAKEKPTGSVPNPGTSVLYGSKQRPWKLEKWVQVDDQRFSGTSQASFKLLPDSGGLSGVSFSGKLDGKLRENALAGMSNFDLDLLKGLDLEKASGFELTVFPVVKQAGFLTEFTLEISTVNTFGGLIDAAAVTYRSKFTAPASDQATRTPRGVQVSFKSFQGFDTTGKPSSTQFDIKSIKQFGITARGTSTGKATSFQLDIVGVGLYYDN